MIKSGGKGYTMYIDQKQNYYFKSVRRVVLWALRPFHVLWWCPALGLPASHLPRSQNMEGPPGLPFLLYKIHDSLNVNDTKT
jgi:hypothetical protein